MRRRAPAAPALLAIVLLCGSFAAPLRGELIDRILAVVEGQVITLSDARAALALRLVPPDVSADPVGAVLQRLVDRQLMLGEVERYAPPEPSPSAVEARVAAIRGGFPSPDAFQQALDSTAMSADDVRRFVRDTLRIESYLQQRFGLLPDPSGQRREGVVDEWLEGLRRRGNIVVVYLPGRG
jgi:hypothetical protein